MSGMGSGGPDDNDGQAGRLAYAGHGPRTATAIVNAGVRRLTPTECMRLQGFPGDWCGTPNEPPDSPRYAAMGDAVTVPVSEWLGERLLNTPAEVTS